MASSQIRVTSLAFVHYQHPNLEGAISFLTDFGLVETSRTGDLVYLRGHNERPYLYIAQQSIDNERHFIGGCWTVDDESELEKATSIPGASKIREHTGPGGGKIVTVKDPNGFDVSYIFGQGLRALPAGDAELSLEQTPDVSNRALTKQRVGVFRRFAPGASPVHKIGHYGFVVPAPNFEETLRWYTSTMNLKPTDAVFDPASKKTETCFMHIDLGKVFTDHHSLFIAAGPAGVPAHIHHSSYEISDYNTQNLGHDFLRSKGHTNCWGIGRHVLGSQVFDYWFDASGNIVEHYSDGDLVNEDTPYGREPAAPHSLFIWGPNIPLSFMTANIDDVGKMFVPPDVMKAEAAVFGKQPVIAS